MTVTPHKSSLARASLLHRRRAFRCSYHFRPGEYDRQMGIKQGGSMIILAGAGR